MTSGMLALVLLMGIGLIVFVVAWVAAGELKKIRESTEHGS